MWGYPRHTVNLSLGFCEDFPVLSAAVASASSSGLLLVAGAGNTNNLCDANSPPGGSGVMFPARYPQVIAVSGTLPDDSFAVPDAAVCVNPFTAPGSRYGSQVKLSAPFHWYSTYYPAGWYWQCGTSFAAPAVTAVAALVWTANPSWTAAQVKNRLFESAKDLGTTGLDQYFGWGRVSAMKAVSINPTATITGRTSVKPNVTCGWEVTHSLPMPPYSYYWEKNGLPVGTNSSLLTLSTGTSSFTLNVVVSNAVGSAISDSHSVTVTSSAPVCLY